MGVFKATDRAFSACFRSVLERAPAGRRSGEQRGRLCGVGGSLLVGELRGPASELLLEDGRIGRRDQELDARIVLERRIERSLLAERSTT